MFDFLFGKAKPTKKSKLHSNKPRSSDQASKIGGANSYCAVKINYKKSCSCKEVLQHDQKIYLASEAPLIPLPNCSRKNECACRYAHLSDRRRLLRRDMDNGLPSRTTDNERRKSNERRKPTSI